MRYSFLTVLIMVIGLNSFAQYPPPGFPFSTEFDNSTDWTLQNSAVAPYTFNSENVLKLTTATTGDRGFAYYNSSFSSSLGLNIEFTYYSQDGTGADGIVFFLLDGDEGSYTSGATGGSLGYSFSPDGTIDGISHGYVGIGFDEFGNFSVDGFGTGGLTSTSPNRVVLRGSGNSATTSAYQYLTSNYYSNGIDGGKRWVRIVLTPDSHISVYVSTDGTNYTTCINNYDVANATGQMAKPGTFQMGFSASTGGSTNFHGIGKLDVSIPVDLSITNKSVTPLTVSYGDNVTISYRVINNGENRVNSVQVSETLPSQLTGANWSFTGTGGSGSGTGDVNITGLDLEPGEYVDVTLNGTAVSLASAGSNLNLNHSASVSTTDGSFGETNSSDNTASISFSYSQPTLQVTNPHGEVIVNDGWADLGPNVTITPNAYKFYSSAKVQITANFQSGDELQCTNLGGLSQSFSGSTLTLSGNADYTVYQTALRNIQIQSSYEDISGNDRIVAITYSLPGYTASSSMTYNIVTNRPPVAVDDNFSRFYTNTQQPYTFTAPGVLENDSDPDGDPITAVLNTDVSSGTLSLQSDGEFTYTPVDGDREVNVSFTYYANDGKVNSNLPATVTIEILIPRFTNANGTGLFSDPLNWNCGYVPNIESLDIIIASGVNMIVDQDYTCKNLQFEMGSLFNCTGGNVLTITEGVLDASGKVAIDVANSLEVRSSIEIPQPAVLPE